MRLVCLAMIVGGLIAATSQNTYNGLWLLGGIVAITGVIMLGLGRSNREGAGE